MNGPTEKANPRDFLRLSVLGAGVLLAGFDKSTAFTGFNRKRSDSFEGGQLLGLLDFVGESPALLNSVIGSGQDARLYSDLSAFGPQQPVRPTQQFYLRSSASELRVSGKPWSIQVGGLVERPLGLSVGELNASTSRDPCGREYGADAGVRGMDTPAGGEG